MRIIHFIIFWHLFLGWYSLCNAARHTDTHTYILSNNENKLLVIDRKTGKERKMQVGINPQMFLIHQSKGYVVNQKGALTCIDLQHHTITKTLKLAHDAKSMVIHGDTGYVLHEHPSCLSVIDLVDDQLIQTLPVVEGPKTMLIFEDTGYITSPESQLITLIDLTTNRITTNLILGGIVKDFQIHDTFGYALQQDILDVLNLKRNSVVHRIHLEHNSHAMVRQDGTLYVLNGLANTVTPINLQTHTADTPITLNLLPTSMVIYEQTGYVINPIPNTVTPIDLEKHKVFDPIPVGKEPGSMHIHEGFGYVINTHVPTRAVAVIDLKTRTLLTTIDNPAYEDVDFTDTHIYLGLEKVRPLYPNKERYKKLKADNRLGEYIAINPNAITVGDVAKLKHLRAECSLIETEGQPLMQELFQEWVDPLDILATLVTLRRPVHFLRSFAGTQVRELLYLHFFQTVWRGDLDQARKMVRYFIQLNDPLIKSFRQDKRFMITK